MDAKFHSENEYGFILNILNNYVVIKKTLKDDHYPYDSFGYLLALYQPLKVYIPQLPHPKIYIEVGGISYDRMIGEFKHEVRQFEKSYDNQQAEQISLMV
ncbi:hypothetical protein [Acinetobacter pittii]|uniref:hypothetical protein n=1 Tax=Acinetobacter pittii TaxID=48296 RepID=UPI002E19C7CC|nr:hypothetical protein [Acinetobacter pittii]